MRFLFLVFLVLIFLFPVNVVAEDISVSVSWNIPNVIPVAAPYGGVFGGESSYIEINNDGSDVYISLKYHVDFPNISVVFSEETFYLKSGEDRRVYVTVSVQPNSIPGVYNVTFRVEASPQASGNVVGRAFEFVLRVVIGGESYRLSVSLVQPDGSPVYGRIRLYYVFGDTINFMYDVLGYKAVFYVIGGEYIVEGVLGEGTVRKRITVNSNLSISLVLSPITLSNFTIVEKPQDLEDPIIFEVKIVNRDPLAYRKEVGLYYDLQNGDNKTIISRVFVTSLVFSGKAKSVVRGIISPPGDGWKNATYRVVLYLTSNDTIIYKTDYYIPITIRIETTTQGTLQTPNILYIVMSAIIGGIISLLSMFVPKKLKKRPIRPRIVGIWSQAPLMIYNLIEKRFEEVPEQVVLSLLPLETIVTTAINLYWRDPDKAIPISVGTPTERQVFYPINKQFALFAFYPLDVVEHDPQVASQMRSLAKRIRRVLEESGIRDYVEFSGLADILEPKIEEAIKNTFEE